jgi:hypothetical protein
MRLVISAAQGATEEGFQSPLGVGAHVVEDYQQFVISNSEVQRFVAFARIG